MITSLGFERNSHEIASPKFAAAVKNLGIEAVVLWMSGTSVNPNDGIWDFHSVNACWHAFNDAGLKIILKRMWAPPQDDLRWSLPRSSVASWSKVNVLPSRSCHTPPEGM